ncbi:hypothetical protein BJX65DRAFT_290548 [Aspergillus insuetus]
MIPVSHSPSHSSYSQEFLNSANLTSKLQLTGISPSPSHIACRSHKSFSKSRLPKETRLSKRLKPLRPISRAHHTVSTLCTSITSVLPSILPYLTRHSEARQYRHGDTSTVSAISYCGI